MDKKISVLFICRHNSARSRMAEAFVNHKGGDRFRAESAGFTPRSPLPVAVLVMEEIDFDISQNPSRSVFDLHEEGHTFDYVITVCDRQSADKCPAFPPPCRHLHWEFPEPSAFKGTDLEILERTRHLRDLIRTQTEAWLTRTQKEESPK